MLAKEVAGILQMELLQGEMAGREVTVKGCYVGDLLSNVMGKAQTGQLWMTVMTNINIVAVAQLLELSGIVLLEGNLPVEGVLERAEMEGIPVYLSRDTAYEAAIRFYESSLAGK
ncbi:MAG: AraC family transcriptional regulator [Clostridiales bacterium]|nr:AraC family transcriptional regulator [Clostridiales bacterium]